VWYAVAEFQKLHEDNVKDHEQQQWAEEGPGVAEGGALVAELEVGTDELAQ